MLFTSSICIAGKELEETGSELHARMDLLNLKCGFFSKSEDDTVNLNMVYLKEILKKFSIGIWKKSWYLEEDSLGVKIT